jgi:branched-chain amino acid transport system ATP-binding protein
MGNDATGLSVGNMTVRYGGVLANDAVSLEVRPAEIVGLIGPNGAGKTTLVDAVTGFAPGSGTVTVDGEPVDGLRPHRIRRRGLSRTWQSGELFSNLTVEQNVLVSVDRGGIRGLGRDLLPGRARAGAGSQAALEMVGLEDVAGELPGTLSLSRQKLVGVARALAGSPKVLLLDEPAAGLDGKESDRFGELIGAIAGRGVGIMLIEHDMRLVFETCHRVYVLEYGKIIASGSADEVRDLPAVKTAYLGTGATSLGEA